MNTERSNPVRPAAKASTWRLAIVVALCGCAATAWGQSADNSKNVVPPPPAPAPAPPSAPKPPPVVTKPQPRLIVQPGKPMIYTTVPQPLGQVPVAITRGQAKPNNPANPPSPSVPDGFERPIRRGGGLGGVKVQFPNVLSRSPSFVPETYGPVSARRPINPRAPWPCPAEPGPRWSRSGSTRSFIGPSGAVYSTGTSLTVGSGSSSTSGFSADVDLGSVQVHVGSQPPLYPSIYGTYSMEGWNGGGTTGCDVPVWCGTRPSWRHCGTPSGGWDRGWWSWYDRNAYYGPVYGSGWYQYDPTVFYPPSVTEPVPDASAAAAPDADDNPNDALVTAATTLMIDGRFSDASKVLREYTRREPKDAGAWRWLAVSLLAERQSKEAVYAFLRAYEINESLSDLPLEYEAMGLEKSDLGRMIVPLLTYAKVTKSASAYLMAAVIMDARGLDDQATRLLNEAKAAGLDPMLVQRVAAGFAS